MKMRFFLLWVVIWLFTAVACAGDREITIKALSYSLGQYSSTANKRLLDWKQLIQAHHNSSIKNKLTWVNTFFNKVQYQTDEVLWGQEEYWATPIELLTLNQGDCEDYAIAKYFTLRAMGVPADQLRIIYVQSLALKQAHMVLMYQSKNKKEQLILDNLNDRINDLTDRHDLIPVYSFNSESLWLPDKLGGETRVGKAQRIKQWQGLQQRMIETTSS